MFFIGVMATLGAAFGRGTGPILLDFVRCDGTEQSLSSCPHPGAVSSFCTHARDAGVMCNQTGIFKMGDGSHGLH